MLQYILRRFLLSLPALWLLVTFVFLLSKLLTGTPGEEQMLQENGGYYSKGSTESRQLVYRNYLNRTGQNLPLFYFSIKASPEPDTLHLVYPAHHRTLLKKLYWQYGNPEAVGRYYQSIKALEAALPVAQKASLQPYMDSLYSTTTPEGLKAIAATPSPSWGAQASELTVAATHLAAQQKSYTFLLPSFRWHGTDNQYHSWLIGVIQGNLGTSFRDGRQVSSLLYDAIANTWWLMLASILIAFVVAFELGMLLVMPQSKRLRKVLLPSLFVIDSIPLFLLALLLLVLLASPSFLQLFPVYGMGYHTLTGESWLQRAGVLSQYLALPVICLTLSNIPYLTNLIYRSFSEERKKDYARTARAKGFSERQVIRKQLLRNTLLPTITVLSDALPIIVAGTISIEIIFAIPGMGRLLVDSVLARDYPVVLAIVLVVAAFRVVTYLLADIFYSLADPRIKHAAS
ncbi:ABC transporter permease [Pontibacter sp. H249]|uniref:ABC transporter permease n=1 Tax=Pontibacter sp. H249 TaxID=3133420 RepID=UPI0030C4F170